MHFFPVAEEQLLHWCLALHNLEQDAPKLKLFVCQTSFTDTPEDIKSHESMAIIVSGGCLDTFNRAF